MRILIACAFLAACGSTQSPNGVDRGWYCLEASRDGQQTSACYRSRDECSAADTTGWALTRMCAPQPIAYCLAVEGSAPLATTSCFASNDQCQRASGSPAPCAASN